MSIFGIAGLALLIGLLIFAIGMLITIGVDADMVAGSLISLALVGAVLLGGIFIGIGIDTENERIFVEKYKIQKATIEQSLDSHILTGLERIKLVNRAITLNGELADRKARFNLWHHCHYDQTIYDDVEFIVFK